MSQVWWEPCGDLDEAGAAAVQRGQRRACSKRRDVGQPEGVAAIEVLKFGKGCCKGGQIRGTESGAELEQPSALSQIGHVRHAVAMVGDIEIDFAQLRAA